jgi:hypothetical protein
MKKSIMAFVMFFMMITTVSFAADSNVYITQSDSAAGLVIDIHIDGEGVEVGTSGSSNYGDFSIGGVYNNLDIDLIGASNKVYGEFSNASENSGSDDLDIQVTGASNITNVLVGVTTATADVKIDQDVAGDSNVITYQIGNSYATLSGTGVGSAAALAYGSSVTNAAVQDKQYTVNLASDSANIYITDISTNAADVTTSVTVSSSSNTQDVDIYKSGTGIHNTTLLLGGASNVVLIAQGGATSGTTTVDIDSSGGGANINATIDTPGTIDLDLSGASVDVDVTILP